MFELVASVIILALIILNAFQLIYWSRQTHKLIDKLMSRNYPEYVQTQSLAAPLPAPLGPFQIKDEPDAELDTLNRTLAGFN